MLLTATGSRYELEALKIPGCLTSEWHQNSANNGYTDDGWFSYSLLYHVFSVTSNYFYLMLFECYHF